MFNHKKFKQLRKEKNLSIEDVAKQIDLKVPTLYQYQSGASKPSIAVVKKIATLFSLDYKELMENSNDNVLENPYKDVLVSELKDQIVHLRSQVSFLQQLILKDAPAELGKLTGNRTATLEWILNEGAKVVDFGKSVASSVTATKQIA